MKFVGSIKRRHLSSVLLFYLLSFFMIIFIILAGANGYMLLRNQQEIIYSQQRIIALEAANTVRSFMNEKFVALETTARLVNPVLTSREEQERSLNHLFGGHRDFRRLLLKNTKKHTIMEKSRLSYVGSSGELLEDLTGNELYTKTEKGERYISGVFVDGRTSEPIVLIAVPLKDFFGDFQGILIAELNLKFMWDLMERMAIGKTGVVYIVDRQGKLIAYQDVSRVLQGEDTGNLRIVYEFMNYSGSAREDKVYVYNGITGKTVIGSYVSLGEPDFAVITEQSVYEAYQAVIRMGIISLVASIIMGGMIVLVSIRLARRLSVPLVNLMNIAGRIAGGERELRARVSGPIEIAGMAEAFNSMTTQLNEVIDNLEQRSEYLQTTVQQYVEYMAGVGKGNLDSFLAIEEKEDNKDDPLIILGKQLNATTLNLNRKIKQIQKTTRELKIKEEILLIYSNQLEKSNKELEQFAYIASHDLQEPLRKLKFFSERLKTRYHALIDEKGQEYIGRMMSAASRMEKLIKGLLEYSRVTTKAQPFKKVDLNEIVEGVLDDLEMRIHETGAEINTEKLPVIEADPLQMRQLFQNLIGNAIKYRRDNLKPVITIGSRIRSNNDNHVCEIKINDNGVGFDNKYSEQIFGLFKRLYSRNEYEGTGIGLAICKKIVEQHRGIISASSTPGEGSTFCIELPVKQETDE